MKGRTRQRVTHIFAVPDMKILLTGSNGMLARDLAPALLRRDHEVIACSRQDLDITDQHAVRDRIQQEVPDVVIQGAAYTAVDAAESNEPDAHRVNAAGAQVVADACREVGALFVYPSTDYVFSSRTGQPRLPSDPTQPINAYGRSKLAGEEAARSAPRHLIVRTSWLYGKGGPNFVDTISRLARERSYLDVVDDQIGIPTWTVSLADAFARLVELPAQGTLHVTDGGQPTSWFDFADEILRVQGITCELRPVPTEGFPRPAPRPAFSVLDTSAAAAMLGEEFPDWREMLRRYLDS